MWSTLFSSGPFLPPHVAALDPPEKERRLLKIALIPAQAEMSLRFSLVAPGGPKDAPVC
jgi:hypothetical protein